MLMEIRVEINTFTLSRQETNQESIVVSVGIAGNIVRQLLKSSSKQCRSSLIERNGPGGS
jgi:hypothetical protein